MTEHGHLPVFNLRHKTGLRWFEGRWDERHQTEGENERGTLDIDLLIARPGRKPIIEKTFEGHWTKRTGPNFREFRVCIPSEHDKIFEATVSFSLTRKFKSEGGGVVLGGGAITAYRPG